MTYRFRLKPKPCADRRPRRRLTAVGRFPTPFETPPGA